MWQRQHISISWKNDISCKSPFKLCQVTFSHRNGIFVFFIINPNTLNPLVMLSKDEWKRKLRPQVFFSKDSLLQLFTPLKWTNVYVSTYGLTRGCVLTYRPNTYIELYMILYMNNFETSKQETLLNLPSPQVAEMYFLVSVTTKMRPILERKKISHLESVNLQNAVLGDA